MMALILIDLQNDFLTGGTLPVTQGETVLPLANQLEGSFRLVVATQDWHPANHKSFATNHPDQRAGDVIKLKRTQQLLWPVHCVQNTRGAELTPALMLNRVNKVFKKGIDSDIDGYSAFFDAGHERATGLHEYLREKKVKRVYILGLGTEYCVRCTALDAVNFGWQTYVIEDACRGFEIQPGAVQAAWRELREAGVNLIQSRDLLQTPRRH